MNPRHNQPEEDRVAPQAERLLQIGSFKELLDHEDEILRRIKALPNGGHLFMIHPFLLFEDIGLKLSEKARKEVLKAEPRLAGLSPIPYRALKASRARQDIRFNVKGLFERRSI